MTQLDGGHGGLNPNLLNQVSVYRQLRLFFAFLEEFFVVWATSFFSRSNQLFSATIFFSRRLPNPENAFICLHSVISSSIRKRARERTLNIFHVILMVFSSLELVPTSDAVFARSEAVKTKFRKSYIVTSVRAPFVR